MSKGALEGIKIVEFCRDIAGPYAAKMLADLGAEVIKIEDPKGGDSARRMGPFFGDVPEQERSGLFLHLNTNKKSVTLNPGTVAGKRIFEELVQNADVLIEDNAPGFMAEMNLDYEYLRKRNAHLIYASITPFGQTGPYSHYKAYHLNSFHAGGEGYLLPGGQEAMDRPPIKAGNWTGEYDSGLHTALAIMGAVFWQYATGEGQYLDISKQEALLNMYMAEYPRYINEDGYIGSRDKQGQTLGGIFPCLDGHVALIFFEDREWICLLKLMGRTDLIEDPTFNTRTAVVKSGRRDEAQAYLLEWCLNNNQAYIYHELQKAGGACGAVYTPERVVNSAQIVHRGFMLEVEHPVAGKLKYPSVPYKLSETPVTLRQAAPLLGQHNEEVFVGSLGYKRTDLVRFKNAGII
jgi:CoA:oxalate CoA-transferase